MSLCPTKDIHSVYLDDELPLSMIKDYEAHIASCPKCAAELEQLKKIRAGLDQLKTPEMSQLEMDESFRRLQIRMSYSKHTKKFEKKTSFVSVVKYTVPAMAAAAVFAIVLPVGLNRKGSETAETSAATIASLPIVTSTVGTNSGFNNLNGFAGNTVSGDNGMMGRSPMGPMRPHGMAQNMGMMNENMSGVVDVFRPNFDNGNTISIKITIPGMNTVPYTTEINVPVDEYKGTQSETN